MPNNVSGVGVLDVKRKVIVDVGGVAAVYTASQGIWNPGVHPRTKLFEARASPKPVYVGSQRNRTDVSC